MRCCQFRANAAATGAMPGCPSSARSQAARWHRGCTCTRTEPRRRGASKRSAMTPMSVSLASHYTTKRVTGLGQPTSARPFFMFDHLICDCDGVLVDSEVIADRVLLTALSTRFPSLDFAPVAPLAFGQRTSTFLADL